MAALAAFVAHADFSQDFADAELLAKWLANIRCSPSVSNPYFTMAKAASVA
jgi:hypothetical protein